MRGREPVRAEVTAPAKDTNEEDGWMFCAKHDDWCRCKGGEVRRVGFPVPVFYSKYGPGPMWELPGLSWVTYNQHKLGKL